MEAENARGLSPRVRGNRPPASRWTRPSRSIPARAGNLPTGPHRCLSYRSIPARAGEPRLSLLPLLFQRVYPRACGGTACCRNLLSMHVGLSPRVRGNLRQGRQQGQGSRSIPARAGEPRLTAWIAAFSRVYPRTCGGTQARERRNPKSYGLSPRVRGNREHGVAVPIFDGSIPARAGEPLLPVLFIPAGEVYPRACGGTPNSQLVAVDTLGLSPRVRGNLSAVMPPV